jgi:hypothetical protein
MTIPREGEGFPDPLTEQQALADHLIRLGTRLQQQHEADPVLVMETALAAVALTRTWLEPDTVQAALAAVPREQLEWWEHEVVQDGEYVAGLLDAVRAALHVPVQEWNRLRSDSVRIYDNQGSEQQSDSRSPKHDTPDIKEPSSEERLGFRLCHCPRAEPS